MEASIPPLPVPTAPAQRLYERPFRRRAPRFIGGPIKPDQILLALNYRKLGELPVGLAGVFAGAMATYLVVNFAIVLPPAPGIILALSPTIVMALLARKFQGAAVAANRRAGGKPGPLADGRRMRRIGHARRHSRGDRQGCF